MKSIHNRTSLVLSLLGGLLLIASGVSGAIGIVGDILDNIDFIFGPDAAVTFEIIVGILAALTIMCGVGIIIGGIVMTTTRVELGRNIVLVAVGTGVLGLFLSLVQAVLVGQLYMSWSVQVAQSVGWVGAILAVEARIIAEQRAVSA
ncbi:MAG: hypothetical protein K9W43_12920 [Candidatus Thorarchaeota archaeon]|nr:hypothetical protein [Candidatus Thorarchaeota archaeon]